MSAIKVTSADKWFSMCILKAWDRKRSGIGLVLCGLLAIVELAVGLHLWVAFR